MRRHVGGLSRSVAILGVLAMAALGETAPGSARLTLRDGRLSAEIAAAPLAQVMAEIGTLAGAEVLWRGAAPDDRVSASFTDVPAAEAIERLLRPRSFFVVGGAGPASIRRVVILADGPGTPRPEGTPAVERPPAVVDEQPDAAVAAATAPGDPATRLRAIDALAEVAAHDPGAWMVLTQLSTSDADRAVREAARRALDAGFPSPVHPDAEATRSSCESMQCRSDLRPHRPRR